MNVPAAVAKLSKRAGRANPLTESWYQSLLIKRAREAQCDVILTGNPNLLPATIRELKQSTSAVALWYPDSVANVGRMSFVAAPFDRLFLTDPLLAERLRDVYGCPAVYLPEACNPRWHYPTGEPGRRREIVVVGNLYPTRVRLLRRLHEAGVPLRLYGSAFPRWLDASDLAHLHTGQFITREDKSRVFREARGVLNNLHPAEMTSVNCRLFEATAAGGVVLTEARPALNELFDVGNETLAFESFDDLLEQCRLLVDGDELNTTVGDAASSRAHADHTYQQRLRLILSELS
jgi:spore maturation protein CgeB